MTIWEQTQHYRKQNLEMARIIIAEPLRYPGLLQLWAEMILARAGETTEQE